MAINGPYISSTQVASSTPFDNTQGNGYVGSDVQSVLQELRGYTIYDVNSTATTTNGTLQLVAPVAGGGTGTAKTLQILTGSATGYSVELPSALGLTDGQLYIIANTTAVTVTIKDGSGATLFTLSQNSIGYLYLRAGGSAAGTWLYYQVLSGGTATGIISYNLTSSTTFTTTSNTEVVITGFTLTPEAGTYGVWASAAMQSTASGSTLSGAIYKTGVQVADSERTSRVAAANANIVFSTQSIVQFNGTDTCDMRVSTTSATMTVAQRSLLMIRLGP